MATTSIPGGQYVCLVHKAAFIGQEYENAKSTGLILNPFDAKSTEKKLVSI